METVRIHPTLVVTCSRGGAWFFDGPKGGFNKGARVKTVGLTSLEFRVEGLFLYRVRSFGCRVWR